MIDYVRNILGYCGECGSPAFVAELRLKGWQHVFHLCGPCLSKLQASLTEASRVVTTNN
jgi:hypothetical protein